MHAVTKSVLVARKKYPDAEVPFLVEVKLFDINDPHLTAEVPTNVLEFKNIECVRIKDLPVSYYIMGNDIVINDANAVKIEQKGNRITIEKA